MCDDATIMHLVLQGTSWNEIETIGIKLERKVVQYNQRLETIECYGVP